MRKYRGAGVTIELVRNKLDAFKGVVHWPQRRIECGIGLRVGLIIVLVPGKRSNGDNASVK